MTVVHSAAIILQPAPVQYAIAYPYAAPLLVLRHHTPEHTEEQKKEKEKEQPQLPAAYKLYPFRWNFL